VLPAQATWFTSPEPKARQTAALLTDTPVQVLEELAETGRDGQALPAEQFEQTVSDYLTAGEAPAGWESRVDATLRIVNTAQAAMEMTEDGDCVLVGHGTAFTLLVAALAGRPPDAAAWRAMRMPDHCELRPGAGGAFEVVSPWGGWVST